MKRLKKLIAFVVTFALVFGAMAVGFAASPFTDVKSDAPYASAVDRLYALGITQGMGDGTYGPDLPLTRAQMVTFVIRMLGLEQVAQAAASEPPAFTDIKGHWAVGYINVAKELKITDGVGDGKFAPDANLTYGQALAFAIRALGYTNVAWGVPTFAKAVELGLTTGINLGFNDDINRGKAAMVLNKALETPMVKYDKDGNPIEGDKLITKVATPTQYVVLATANQTDIDAGKVKLYDVEKKSEVVKNAGNLDFAKYVGKTVKVYYAKDGTPVLISEETNTVKEYKGATINSDGVVKDSDGNTVQLANKDVSVKDIPILYNGYLTNWNAIKGNIPSSVDVTLIDNNNDKTYDYAVVTGYSFGPLFVKADVGSDAKYIATDSGNYTLVKSDGKAYRYTVVGDAAKLSDIKANDVVYYGKQYDADGNQIGIYLNVVRKTVTGKVTEISDKIKIGDTAYSVAAGSTYTTSNAQIGDEGTFVLDKDGKIFRFLGKVTATANYAVVLDSAPTGSSLTAKIKLLTADGTKAVYGWDSKVNGQTVTDNVDLRVGTLVKYDINADKTVVSKVYSSDVGDVKFMRPTTTNISLDVTNKLVKVDDTPYYLSDNTVIFNYNGTDYSVVKLADINSISGVKAIAYDNYRNVKAIVFDRATYQAKDTTTVIAYVTNTVTVKTADATFTRITAFVNGEKKTYDLTEEKAVTKYTAYQLKIDKNTGKVIEPVGSDAVTAKVYAKDIDTVNMTLKTADGTPYQLLPGYQVIKVNDLDPQKTTSASLVYVSDIPTTTTEPVDVKLYLDPTTKKVAVIVFRQ